MQLKFLKSKLETNNFSQNRSQNTRGHLGENLDRQKTYRKDCREIKSQKLDLKKTHRNNLEYSSNHSENIYLSTLLQHSGLVWETSKYKEN